ncbi:MAG: peptidoglycan-binding domain-containing protein [Paracoccus sp. (in: a-proteobacteria)]|uniref:peptidoglycan-binding domain-containing protein n=1 Tax=Paracoccus sp. TaxID=267 RepID=UPI0026E0E03B|nr:peptidoglycan-binding protein [Paracoccus sp. (in: a-proteobacteria)]MDO5630954.1 peptidoglycan-binding domain-containing protein [Paracoccus sp. (in: a-proteobacteria)]
MRNTIFSALMLAGLTAAPAAQAQDLGQIISGVAQGLLAQELERNAWDEARQANTANAYRNYLNRFPNGAHASNARQALNRLTNNGNSRQPSFTAPVISTPATQAGRAARTEAELNLTRSDRVRVQRQLTQLGYNTQGADGLWGNRTRSAIQSWQRAHNHSATGYVTAAQVRQINQQAGAPTNRTPSGNQQSDAQVQERLLSLGAAERRELQLRLTLLGYNTRGTDGVFGTNTRNAIRRWQGDHGLRQTGYLTADQVKTLRSETRG